MRIVTAQEMQCWLDSGKVLEQDARGPKVVALENGLFLKIFHTRRHPLLARLKPAARRFAENARCLNNLNIKTPLITDLFWLDKQAGLSGCLYQPLPGTSLEQIYMREPEQIHERLSALAAFIRELHRKRIYFRSLHLGNILLLPSGEFGLIDFLDMSRKRTPISAWRSTRNFAHLKKYLLRKKINTFPTEKLITLYREME
ncbi:MAG: lipopolysaccharide kinase InaA family protein [Pseudomonas sp.]|nr:lipopolysaccharide kinase InaA family protein [Pseudomonas sp.]